jgi:diguanylate cyclase (GGDEF)-like protein
MRGFNLLTEQTLRLAQRAQLPFSVLFIDLDDLKQINDKLGHASGSAYIAETGRLLDATFRAGDVKGRFGGDEFVVAGQFSVLGIELAVQRLVVAAAAHTASDGRGRPLSFSIGYVTCEYYSDETLRDLVIKADEKMYQDKRRKKMQTAEK